MSSYVCTAAAVSAAGRQLALPSPPTGLLELQRLTQSHAGTSELVSGHQNAGTGTPPEDALRSSAASLSTALTAWLPPLKSADATVTGSGPDASSVTSPLGEVHGSKQREPASGLLVDRAPPHTRSAAVYVTCRRRCAARCAARVPPVCCSLDDDAGAKAHGALDGEAAGAQQAGRHLDEALQLVDELVVGVIQLHKGHLLGPRAGE